MRCNFWILMFLLFGTWNVFSQEKYIQHIVAKGETVFKIAQQYHLDASQIYAVNPNAKDGIKFEQVLLIPFVSDKNGKLTANIKDDSEGISTQKQHLVLAKETLYGIAKQYGVKVTDLYSSNPLLKKKGLRVGSSIIIPGQELKDEVTTAQKEISAPEVKQDTENGINLHLTMNVIKEVLAKETLYGIAKEYGVSVSDIQKANPILETQALRTGQKIVIPTTNNKIKKEETALKNEVRPTVEDVQKTLDDAEVEVSHEVVAKETKYGIAKEYGITVKELEIQNPKITAKLLIGEKLKIRTLKSNVKTPKKFDFTDEGISKNESVYVVEPLHDADFIEKLIATASENIGVRYRTGGTTKDGFDCSGLMCTTFGAFDIQLPRTSFEQSQYGVKVNSEEAQKGDLIFFKTNGRSQINHVGMVVEVDNGDIKFIHASVGGGVIISSIKEKYYSKRVTQINRVL
ncbi:LysM peptidoglycan-binding domain-containing protein [Flavobacterium sp. ST-87]|uniref:LysM peptidoglycan-binding domain-containing protein n=1 Tax=Flavobacterium plantiphilum TaxID=3163297 RepID=A0ABW8XS74_9FLAO